PDAKCWLYCFGLDGRLVRRAWKSCAGSFCARSWKLRLARDARRLVARARRPRCVVDLARQFRGARASERASAARLLGRRTWWLHVTRDHRRRSRWVFRDVVLHQHLRGYTRWRVRRRRRGSPRKWRRRFTKFRRTGGAVAIPRCLDVDLPLVARRSATVGGIFWKILSFQRGLSGRWKSRFALARRARSLRQLRIALLLLDRPQSDLR